MNEILHENTSYVSFPIGQLLPTIYQFRVMVLTTEHYFYTQRLSTVHNFINIRYSVSFINSLHAHALTAIYGTTDGKYDNIKAHCGPKINTVFPKYHSVYRH